MTSWAFKQNTTQSAVRAGRTIPGIVYLLHTLDLYSGVPTSLEAMSTSHEYQQYEWTLTPPMDGLTLHIDAFVDVPGACVTGYILLTHFWTCGFVAARRLKMFTAMTARCNSRWHMIKLCCSLLTDGSVGPSSFKVCGGPRRGRLQQ